MGQYPKTATVDRGCKGQSQIGETKILIPQKFDSKKQSQSDQKRLKKHFKRRAAIEPIIGHLKRDHRLGLNFHKGIIGDNVNLLLSAAAFNFKRMMNQWKSSFFAFFKRLFFIVQNFLEYLLLTKSQYSLVFKA